MQDLVKFRAEKDHFFGTSQTSPRTRQQQLSFRNLRYFDENSALRLVLSVEKQPAETPVVMQTTTGDMQTYVRYGHIRFDVEGETVDLTVFASDDGLFMPFADALAGRETYGGGRYLELEALGEGKFRVDFSLAYNPYCAYNDKWSCPITPAENRLKTPIRAGEMVFHD